MQTWSWVLAVCLAAAVTARPEGKPATVEAVRVVPSGASNAIKEDLAVEHPKAEVQAFKPLPIDEVKDQAAKPMDEVKKDEAKDTVKEQPLKETQGEEDAMKLPVPIEPDYGSPDDSKVFPEGALRTPNAERTVDASSRVVGEKPASTLVPVAVPGAVPPAQAEKQDNEDERKTGRVARAYLPAEARGSDDSDGLELNLHPDTVLVPYYGGAKGQYLIVAKPVRAGDINKAMKKPARPGHKEEGEEEEEEEENVGEETNEEKPSKPPGSDNDTVTIAQPPASASMAEAKPVGIAIAGEGGVASARPQGVAIVGPGGLAVSRPVGTAIAGIQGAEYLITGGAQPQFQPSAFVYPLGPAVASPLGVPLPYNPNLYNPNLYAGNPYNPNLHAANPAPQPLGHPGQWIVYPPPPPPPYQYV